MKPKEEERREIVKRLLRDPRAKHAEIAKEYGVARQSVYKWVEDAMCEPKEKLAEAREKLELAEMEVEFRREVLRLERRENGTN